MNRSLDVYKPRFTRVKRNHSAPHALRSPVVSVKRRTFDKVTMVHTKLHEMGFTAITRGDIKQMLSENGQNVERVIDKYINFFRSASPQKKDKVEEVYDKLHEMGFNVSKKSIQLALARHDNNVDRVINDYMVMQYGNQRKQNTRKQNTRKRKPIR